MNWECVEAKTRIEGPHGWIQWKGTNVCMDLHCECGAHGHIDAEFAYKVRCCKCGRCYVVGAYVKLVEVSHHDEMVRTGVRPIDFAGDEE